MKRAFDIEKKDQGFVVYVNDNGYICKMCHLDKDDNWKTCYFPTKEDAERAQHDYNEIWKGE